MHVERYDCLLDLDFGNLTFEGRIFIELESEADVALDSVGLSISGVTAGGMPLLFEQSEDSLVIKTGPFKGTVDVQYTGRVSDILVGIYRAPYDNTYMVTTQFEASHARRMIPCVDQPEYKAEFRLTVRLDKNLDAISNMPIEAVTVEGDKKTVSFQKTPRMSTYLLYLGVGKFEEIKDNVGNTSVILATTPGKADRGKFALEVARRSIEFYQSYFDIPYMLPKVHLIAVPEFAAGAMENWGAITFRESALLVDENSDVKTKKRVAEVVAHELAHMWVGNLVTMKWWDDLWLNESFATFMAYCVIDVLYPQWKVWQDFLGSETSGAMARDALRNTHSIEVQVRSPSEVEQLFDEISYGKGASILRMVEAYMGAEEFRKGTRNYLVHYKFSNATGKDLWRFFDEASGELIEKIASEWVSRPGYPLVTAELRDGKLVLRQERFLLSGASEKDVRPIPLVMKVGEQVRRLLFEKDEEEVAVDNVNSLKLNSDQTGFYRVYYKGLYDLVWKGELSALDRWGIVSDALAFLMAGKLSFDEYLSLVDRYRSEEDYLPAREVSDQLTLLHSIIPSRVAEVTKRFHTSQLVMLTGKKDENSSMLRGIMAGRLAMVDEDYAMMLGSRFEDYAKVEPDMKEAVAVAYARTFGDFEGIVRRYRKSSSDEDKVRLLIAMMSFKDASSVALSYGLALSNEVKKQDISTMILAAARNHDAMDVTWMWMKVNLERLGKLYEGTGKISRILMSTIPIIGIGRVEGIKRFFEQNRIVEADKGIKAGMELLEIYDGLVSSV